MKWIVIALFVVALLLFAVGKWQRIIGQSPDEKAGSDLFYLLGMVLIVVDVLVLVVWACAQLFF